VIVEDQTIFRELLAEVLDADRRCQIVAQCREGREALARYSELRPDLVILDAMLPDVPGLEVLSGLLQQDPLARVLMVTGHARLALVQEALARGARGFVTKGTPLRELRQGVETVLAGGRFVCSVTSKLLESVSGMPPVRDTLTARQRDIVRLVAQGLSSKEIAAELGISAKTVANHRLQIGEKLRIHDIASLTRYAIERGLAEPKV
jgi:DNA-binding NarL/FixJ family response regulator